MAPETGPLAGERRQRAKAAARWAAGWVAWWSVLMSLWVALDDSLAADEVLAGTGAAAIAALAAQAACHQPAPGYRIRWAWLLRGLALPRQVARDTVLVYGVLWRKVIRGEDPCDGFTEEQVDPGPGGPEGTVRRVLLLGARSLAPNAFALGIDAERAVIVVHRLDPGGKVT